MKVRNHGEDPYLTLEEAFSVIVKSSRTFALVLSTSHHRNVLRTVGRGQNKRRCQKRAGAGCGRLALGAAEDYLLRSVMVWSYLRGLMATRKGASCL